MPSHEQDLVLNTRAASLIQMGDDVGKALPLRLRLAGIERHVGGVLLIDQAEVRRRLPTMLANILLYRDA